MHPEFLSQVKELVINKIRVSIGKSNLIEEVMSYSALAESKMIRAGLVFASSRTNKNLHENSPTLSSTSCDYENPRPQLVEPDIT